MKNLNLRHLRIFETIASCGSFSRAADQLGMSQPAVSMQLRQLETDLGTVLFERPQRQRLTEAGQELLQHARMILAQARAAEDAMALYEADPNESGAGPRGARGLLHLGVVSTAHYFAPRLLNEFHRRHPEVRLKLTVAKRHEVLAMLQEHRLDLAITGYPPSEADVEAQSFARHPHCIVAPPDHPLARRRKLGWGDLRDEHFIFRESGSATRQFFEHLLQSQSIQVRVGMELAGNETIKQAVMCGMGISFLSAHAFQVELAAGLMVVLDVVDMPKHIDWCVVQRRDTVLTGVNAAFREFVFEQGAAVAACRVS
ncbi:LysR family transcriptional regulator [Piscinibacter gummiphilus]|uniref:LysR family transcriptional regulator n=1 Tax=Piscinibacter gummiphilus TaxID=946333 RepID=A0A1W6L2H4_9BURK|nr:LysR substrate-binding domain-containing protein [Piscinibacter gummiphilus]ARN18459.1 LysR family transcriptional regulator [Piscinibacter gummiphilus]ATU63087.1 LysR family transcriptional regulator [Piscinibacter gummiphilus]GLS95396.1 LysR family transcriptional regulator [Piscinibacter gummiphilus]